MVRRRKLHGVQTLIYHLGGHADSRLGYEHLALGHGRQGRQPLADSLGQGSPPHKAVGDVRSQGHAPFHQFPGGQAQAKHFIDSKENRGSVRTSSGHAG